MQLALLMIDIDDVKSVNRRSRRPQPAEKKSDCATPFVVFATVESKGMLGVSVECRLAANSRLIACTGLTLLMPSPGGGESPKCRNEVVSHRPQGMSAAIGETG